jgi:creatinine amidohydrolase
MGGRAPAEREVRFAKLRLPELNDYATRSATILIPIGAIEQHGPHLPVETDSLAATTLSIACAEAFDDVLVLPTVPWGLSNSHVDIGGTLTVRPTTLLDLGMDLTESLVRMGFGRIVWVNGHLGNRPFLGLAVYESKRRFGLSVGALTYFELGADEFNRIRRTAIGGTGHACEFETSLLLHLAPEAVAPYESHAYPVEPFTNFDFRDITHSGAASIGYTFKERFPEGVAGDPSAATAATGEAIFIACRDALISFVDQYQHVPVVVQSANQAVGSIGPAAPNARVPG